MKLFYSTTSPFARKVLIALKLLQLESRVELVISNPFDNPPELLQANPLGKIPALQLDNGNTLCDSNLILHYLDSLSATPKLYPQNKDTRWQTLNLAYIAEGILNAAVAARIEHVRPENVRYPAYIERQLAGINRSLQFLHDNIGLISDKQLSVLEITLVCALDYLDFRFAELHWAKDYPQLRAWQQTCRQQPIIQASTPHEGG